MVTGCGRKVREPVINTKDSIKVTKNMAMVFFHGHLEMSIKAITSKISELATGRCIGVMAVTTKVNG